MNRIRTTLAVGLVAVLAGCGPTTKLTAVWVAERPDAPPLSNVMILAIDASEPGRRKYEDAFVEELKDRSTKAVQGYMVLPLEGQVDEDVLRAAVAQGGYDAVLITRLLGVDQEQVYVPPTEYVTMGTGYGMYGYYGMGYTVQSTPGYMKTHTTVRLETHIYDAYSAELIWAGHSDTFDPATPEAAIKSVVSLIALRLEHDGLVPKD